MEFAITVLDSAARLIIIGYIVLRILAFYRTRKESKRYTWRTVLFRDDEP